MLKRELNNIGQPLRGPNGEPQGGIRIEFVLSLLGGIPTDAVDATDHERYIPIPLYVYTATEDTEELKVGEYKIDLWPTSRADRQVFYRCTLLNVAGARPFVAPIIESDQPLKWSDFAVSGAQLTPAQTSALALHVQDNSKHLTEAQNAALDAAHSPSAGNPIATIQDIAVAGGAISATDVLYGIVRLATAAQNPADPLVVGDNDGRLHTHANSAALGKISEAEELPRWNGSAWPGNDQSSGHMIINPVGNAMPQRSKLKFDFEIEGNLFAVSLQDDALNDTTIILITFPDVIGGGNF